LHLLIKVFLRKGTFSAKTGLTINKKFKKIEEKQALLPKPAGKIIEGEKSYYWMPVVIKYSSLLENNRQTLQF